MMKVNQMLATGGLAVALCFGVASVLAQTAPPAGGGNQGGGRQGRGNFDPAQMQQRMMERYKEQLEITDDAEWKVIQPLVQKVWDARMATMSGMGRGMFGRRGGPGGGGTDTGNTQRSTTASQNPDADALQKAIDAKASNAEMKTALTKFAASRKVKQAELEKAQDALRKVLSVRQEAIASMNGLL
jgi:hypothetical protein